jgi:hypothetical protein
MASWLLRATTISTGWLPASGAALVSGDAVQAGDLQVAVEQVAHDAREVLQVRGLEMGDQGLAGLLVLVEEEAPGVLGPLVEVVVDVAGLLGGGLDERLEGIT